MYEMFYLVWREDSPLQPSISSSCTPTYKHSNRSSAEIEAERLCRQNPGVTFHVMACVGSCRKVDVEWKKIEEDKLPF